MRDTPSPPLSPAEALTLRFYEWECRARGYAVSPCPVVLEPPFEPFFHVLPLPPPGYDDGREPGLGDWLRSLILGGQRTSVVRPPDGAEEEPQAEALQASTAEAYDDVVELQVLCPDELDVTPDLAERLILGLGDLGGPVSFEIVGGGGATTLQVAVGAGDAESARQLIEAYVPDATVIAGEDRLASAWRQCGESASVVIDFGLSREAVLPIRTFRSLALDPLLGILAPLQDLGVGELGILQVRFQRTVYPWAESMVRAVSDGEGRAFFADAPEMLPLAREKVSSPLLACTIRVAARGAREPRAWDIARAMGRAFGVLAEPTGNEILALANDGYPDEDHAEDVLARQSRRSGMILSVRELAGLVHLPGSAVRSPGLRAPARTTKLAPACAHEGDVSLGVNTHRGRAATVSLPRELRFRHTYVVGATGTGKSTLLLSMIQQDIEAGRGVGLIDPHGDLVDDVLGLIPEARHGDVVLFDPADEECPVGFNVLQARTDRERDLLASDLVAVFRRLSTSWGDQMTAVLGNAVMAFLESEDGGTLLDLRRFLVDKGFREERLRRVRDPAVVAFFRTEFPLLYGRPQAPILTRLDAFLRPKRIRAVVSQRQAKLDLGGIMDRGKIFLARLAQGAIGEENAYLMGSLLVSQLHQAALARERMAASERRDFLLYLDEFHHFVTPSLASMLSGARKFRVGLVLAHQELRQLGDREVASAVLANAATRVCFRIGDDDARKLAEGFSSFTAADLLNLSVGEAICRIERADQDCNLRVVRQASADPETVDRRRAAIRELSRREFGTPRAEVEAEIAKAFADPVPGPATAASPHIKEESRAEPRRAEPEGSAQGNEDRAPPPPRPRVPQSRGAAMATPASAPGGRGGPQHKYLQGLIKRLAEDRGFRATLEAPVEGGGRIDVLLAREGLSVACEISVASTPAQEVENLRKCRESGASRVVLVSPERRTLRAVEKLLPLAVGEGAPLSYCTPDELLALLDGLASPIEEREETVRGYRVRMTVRPAGPDEPEDRRGRVAGTILAALRRLRGNG